jgi:hypothetical protein
MCVRNGANAVLFGENSLSRVMVEYDQHYHHERTTKAKATDFSSKTNLGK